MSPEPSADRLQVFVYGSLKRGFQNHQGYCRGYLEVREATVLGRLYLQPSGYPMLVIPSQDILAVGTREAGIDLATQTRLANERMGPPTSLAHGGISEEEGWQWITGEIFSFDDAGERLGHLDFLEDFRPGEPCLYHRVVAVARQSTADEEWVPVWMYVAPDGVLPNRSILMGTSWP